jgi:hypothetical protein
MGWDSWIALTSSFAAGAAVLVAIFTLREMISQRKTVYRPELIIAREYISSKRDRSDNHQWARSGSQSSDRAIFLSVPLFNIGLGAARDVEIHWSYEREKFRALLREQSSHRILVQDSGPIAVEIDGKPFMMLNPHDSIRYLSYVLPAGVSSEPNFVNVPIEYSVSLELLSRAYAMTRDEKRGFAFESIPPLEATIQYRDIGDNFHERKMQVNFHFSSLTFGDDEETIAEAAWHSEIIALNSPTTLQNRLLRRLPFVVSGRKAQKRVGSSTGAPPVTGNP